jgi:membrane associated rhomboid family serine protease
MAYAASEPLRHATVLGSSGAVAAVLGAYFALYPRSQVLTVFFAVVYFDVVEVPAIFFLGMWLFFQVVIGVPVAVPPAGFVIGLVVGLPARRRSRWSRG